MTCSGGLTLPEGQGLTQPLQDEGSLASPPRYPGAAGVGRIAVSVDEATYEKIQDVVSSLSKDFNIQPSRGLTGPLIPHLEGRSSQPQS